MLIESMVIKRFGEREHGTVRKCEGLFQNLKIVGLASDAEWLKIERITFKPIIHIMYMTLTVTKLWYGRIIISIVPIILWIGSCGSDRNPLDDVSLAVGLTFAYFLVLISVENIVYHEKGNIKFSGQGIFAYIPPLLIVYTIWLLFFWATLDRNTTSNPINWFYITILFIFLIGLACFILRENKQSYEKDINEQTKQRMAEASKKQMKDLDRGGA